MSTATRSLSYSTLATDEPDTRQRFETIAASARAAKTSLEKLSASAITQYTIALMSPYILSLVSGMAGRTRPVFNVTVSNLPGPRKPLYINGAEMEAFYPTSLVTHGQALNITVHGYADTLGFGFIGCRDSLPSLQHIAVYAGEALDELRQLYGPKDQTPAAAPHASGDSAARPAAETVEPSYIRRQDDSEIPEYREPGEVEDQELARQGCGQWRVEEQRQHCQKQIPENNSGKRSPDRPGESND